MTARRTKFGIALPSQHTREADGTAVLRDSIELLQAAEEQGWDSVFTGQHFLLPNMKMFQPVAYLGRLAAETDRMLLGLGIALAALTNPVQLAEDLATLDVLSGGRLIVGVGLGYRQEEYRAFGVDPKDKVLRLEANLEAMVALWSGEPTDIDLPWCQVTGGLASVTPLQQPRPPLWMAAHVDAAVRRAARLADAWYVSPHVTTAEVKRQLVLFHEERVRHGLPPGREIPIAKEIYCAPTRELALEVAERYVGDKYKAYAEWGQDKVLPGDVSFTVAFQELTEGRFVVGTPEDCIAGLSPLIEELGATHLVFRAHLPGMPRQTAAASMRLLADEVLPALGQLQRPDVAGSVGRA